MRCGLGIRGSQQLSARRPALLCTLACKGRLRAAASKFQLK